jgi:hypothetical protein
MTAALFEPTPRWPNAPLICLKTNLPAFDSKQDMNRYFERYCPGAEIRRMGKCATCGLWHGSSEELKD